MNGFFHACAVITAAPMVLHRDPVGSLVFAINPLFWLICARFA